MLTDYCRTVRDDELPAYQGFPFWLKQTHEGYVSYSKHATRVRALTFAYADEYSVYCSDNVPLDAKTCANYPYILAVYQDGPEGGPSLARVFAYAKKSEAQEAARDIKAEDRGVRVESIGFVLPSDSPAKSAYADCARWVVRAEDDGLCEESHVIGGIELAFSVFVGTACEWGDGVEVDLYAEDARTGAKTAMEAFFAGEDGCLLRVPSH